MQSLDTCVTGPQTPGLPGPPGHVNFCLSVMPTGLGIWPTGQAVVHVLVCGTQVQSFDTVVQPVQVPPGHVQLFFWVMPVGLAVSPAGHGRTSVRSACGWQVQAPGGGVVGV